MTTYSHLDIIKHLADHEAKPSVLTIMRVELLLSMPGSGKYMLLTSSDQDILLYRPKQIAFNYLKMYSIAISWTCGMLSSIFVFMYIEQTGQNK